MKKLIVLAISIMLSLPSITLAGKGGGTTPPPGAQWSMFMNNSQHNGQSSYVGPRVGEEKWSISTGMSGEASVVIGKDGTIYFVGYNYFDATTNTYYPALVAYDPNRNLKWHYRMPQGSNITPAIDSAGNIYANIFSWQEYKNYLYAISPQGTLLWQTELGGTLFAGLIVTISKDGTIYTHGSEITAVNPDGTIKWKYYCNIACSSVALSPGEDTIYTVNANYSGILTAIDKNGQLLWQYGLGDGAYRIDHINPIAVGRDGVIYTGAVWWDSAVGKDIPYMYAIEPTSILRWQYTVKNGESTWAMINPAVSDRGDVYFIMDNIDRNGANLYALDSQGLLRWKYTIVGSTCTNNNGITIDANGDIYFTSVDNPMTIYKLTSGGRLKWSLTPQGYDYFWGTSPAIGADGTIYIRSGSGNFYAIGQ